jgi:serpin B
VYIPKFKFETKYFMAEDLKGMGMPTAFTLGIDFGGEADFSGMTGNKRLNIDEVIHQAFVEVNEEGTEAAAATAVVMQSSTIMPRPTPIFKADHPFIFVIQEKETGDILFLGRVTNPTS